MLTKKTTRPPPRVAVYWLISRDDNGRSETLTMGRGGERRLPVFSFREEAEMFLSLRTLGAGWSVKQTTAGELVSVLMGPYGRFGKHEPRTLHKSLRRESGFRKTRAAYLVSLSSIALYHFVEALAP
jgi:hypothetical protein